MTTGVESHGDVYEQRVEYAPGSPFPPLHRHPVQRELFQVERGSMIYIVGGEERRVGAGETLQVGVAVPHKARNASDTEIAVVRWETRPALRSQAFYATAAQLGGAGMLERALLAHEYRDVFRASGPLGVVTPLLAAIARLLGRRLPEPG
jgi:mannose-6-phosphate isomerase-like protein (cupin superfamily)